MFHSSDDAASRAVFLASAGLARSYGRVREHFVLAFFASILLSLANSSERRQALARHVRITVNGTARTNRSKRATPRPSGSYRFEMMPHNLGSLNTQNCWGLP